MRTFAKLQDLQALVGPELGLSGRITVDQQRIDPFAQATGDHQRIHIDPVKAAQGPFGRMIAHGFLTLSLLPELFAQAFGIGDVRMGANHGPNKVRFTAPVPSGSRVRGRFVLRGHLPLDGGAQPTVDATIELEGSSRPAGVAEMISRRCT